MDSQHSFDDDSSPRIVVRNDPRLRPRRDPFRWILASMGAILLVCIPLLAITLLFGDPIAIRVLLGTFVVAMAILVLASVAVAVRKGAARHSIRDLLWLTFAVALVCILTTSSNDLVWFGALFTLIAALTFWWTKPEPRESKFKFLLRIGGNGVIITGLIVIIVAGFLTALAMALNGQGR